MNNTKKFQKKSLIKWGVITLIVIVIGYIIYGKVFTKEEQPNYITATAEFGDIENNVMASGKVKALNTVNVGAQVSGEITKLYVKVGDEVKKGDLIAQIDQVTQRNNLSNQQASLQQTHAGLQSAQADYYSRQASLKSAIADLDSREAELKQAQNELQRLKQLVDIQAISQKEYEAAQTNVDTASARVKNAKAAIDTAKAAIISAESNIVSSQASMQKAQTDLDTAKENLGYTTIRAPIDGTVVSVTTEQGSTVNANQSAPTIVTLADLSTVRINAQISEADVINVKAGMPVYFNTIGNPDKKYDAVLTAIEPAPENISNSSATDAAVYYIGYVEVPNPDRLFRIDMTAQIFIILNRAKNALLVPSAAVHKGIANSDNKQISKADSSNSNNTNSDNSQLSNKRPATMNSATINSANNNNQGQKYYVRVLKDDGSVEEKPVKIGIDNRINTQILSGLKQGETVIVGEDRTKPDNKSGPKRMP